MSKEEVTIYHNPRCKKSKATLALIQEKGIEPEIVEYLKNTPDRDTLASLLEKLNKKPEDIIRKQEKVFKENYKGRSFSEDEWLNILHQNPKLIERPIVVKGDKAVIGRPPENVLEIIE